MRRDFPWFMFIMIMNLILGRATKKKKEELKVQFISSSEPRYEKPTVDPYDDDEILIPGLELDGPLVFCDEDAEVFSEGKGLSF
jgi:hypothetical protein